MLISDNKLHQREIFKDDNYDDVDDDDDNKEEEHVTLQDFKLLLAPQLTSSRRRIYAKR